MIIHLTDTDGVFIPDENVVSNQNVIRTEYSESCIKTLQADNILSRNHKKSDILRKLQSTGKIHSIPYRIYFNSCNLEHVLYGTLRYYTDEEKEILSDNFAEKYENNLAGFIEFISDSAIATPGTYRETWKYIEKGTNSLNRNSNMHLIFN